MRLRAMLLVMIVFALAACERNSVDHQALRSIVGDEPVVLLSASWCGYCRKLRGDLTQWNVPFRELDVETSASGESAWRLLKARSIPVLLIGRDIQHGYAPEQARRTLDRHGLLPKDR